MLVRVFRRLTATGRSCVISAREPLAADLAAQLPANVVLDRHDDAGPLAGIAAGAAAVQTRVVFVAAADLPNIDAAFVDDLEAAYRELDAAGAAPDALVPTWPDGRREPLAALYATRPLARAAAATLAAGDKKVTAAFDHLRVAAYPVRPHDEEKLINVNTSADYEAARR